MSLPQRNSARRMGRRTEKLNDRLVAPVTGVPAAVVADVTFDPNRTGIGRVGVVATDVNPMSIAPLVVAMDPVGAGIGLMPAMLGRRRRRRRRASTTDVDVELSGRGAGAREEGDAGDDRQRNQTQ
jgi:hypothetical protein